MSNPESTRKKHRKPPREDRRAPASAKGLDVTLRRIKGMLGRPVRLQRRDGHLHVVLVDRRKARPVGEPPSMDQLRADLRTRLFVQRDSDALRVMRHLAQVHDELGRKGWPGVAKLPLRVLSKALVQAQMLASEDYSPALGVVIEQLRMLQTAAELQAERRAQAQAGEPELEVSEVSHLEYEAMQHNWLDTVSPEPVPGPGPGPGPEPDPAPEAAPGATSVRALREKAQA